MDVLSLYLGKLSFIPNLYKLFIDFAPSEFLED